MLHFLGVRPPLLQFLHERPRAFHIALLYHLAQPRQVGCQLRRSLRCPDRTFYVYLSHLSLAFASPLAARTSLMLILLLPGAGRKAGSPMVAGSGPLTNRKRPCHQLWQG